MSTSHLSSTVELLAAERAALTAAVARVPVELQSRSLAPGRWSVVDVIDHLTRVETGIARLLLKRGRPGENGPVPEGKVLADLRLTSEHVAHLRDRAHRIEAPERVRPSGTADPATAWQALEAARGELLRAFAAADPDALDNAVHEHAVLGPLVLRDWVTFVAHHEARHCAQVAEIADALVASGSDASRG
ncbi:MAG TPA: DinB family protein [Gemmatimonadaceae bacterium]|nr:DinB family protein [Gemmatimonadaceae bacterium]